MSSLKENPLLKSRDVVRFPIRPKGWDVVSGLNDAKEYTEPAGNGDFWVVRDECPYEGCDDCPYDCDDDEDGPNDTGEFSPKEAKQVMEWLRDGGEYDDHDIRFNEPLEWDENNNGKVRFKGWKL